MALQLHSGTLVQMSTAGSERHREKAAKPTLTLCSIFIFKTVTHTLCSDGRHTCTATKEIDPVVFRGGENKMFSGGLSLVQSVGFASSVS